MKLLILLTLIGFSLCRITVDPELQHFTDPQGRIRLFHGVNAVYKPFPFYPPIRDHFDPSDSLSAEDFKNLQSWGLNFIRLHVAWEGVEPMRNHYNLTYLQQLKEIIEEAAEYDIQVLLDSHQDLLSKKFCGEGFPDWSMREMTFPKPLPFELRTDEHGYPLREDCLAHEFGLYYATIDVQHNFMRLFENKDSIGDAFANQWKTIAQYMQGLDNLIGYELLNEPFGNSFYSHPLRLLDTNNLYLLPFYQKVNEAIRTVDQDTLVFFEPATSDIFHKGFSSILGTDPSKEVFSYHAYCPEVDLAGDPKNELICKAADEYAFRGKQKNARKIGLPGFLTEFGALSNSDIAAKEIATVTELAEKQFHSWAYWQFKYYGDMTTQSRPATVESFYDDSGNLNSNKVKALSRTYAYAISGVPVDTKFNPTNGHFSLEYQNKNLSASTEIFMNKEFYYPKGHHISCSVACKLSAIRGKVNHFTLDLEESVEEGQLIKVEIRAL